MSKKQYVNLERFGKCEVVENHGFGTIDVKCIDDGKYYRVTGLNMSDCG